MTGVGSVGNGVDVQRIYAQKSQAALLAAKGTAKSSTAEEKSESASQEAAEHEGGGLNLLA